MSSSSHEHSISMGSDPTIIAALEANVKIGPVYNKLKKSITTEAQKREKEGSKTEEDRAEAITKIQKVPAILRAQKDFEKYYEPRWISIGPFHHDQPNLKLAENLYKLELVSKFINDSGSNIESAYATINKEIEQLKKLFNEDVISGYDDDTLSWMLFLDGCSVLQLINSYVKNELKTFSIKNEHIAYAQQDLFLMENQIPFAVLKLLMESTKKSEELMKSVKDFIRCIVMTPNKYKKNLNIKIDDDPEPAHLLELLRLAIIQPPKASRTRCDLTGCLTKKSATDRKGQGQQSFRSVQDLMSAGIDLKPSESCSLRDITFTSLCFAGWLKLPRITVDDLTGARFLNLIDYECVPTISGPTTKSPPT